MPNSNSIVREEVRQEEYIFSIVLEPYKKEIVEIKKSYDIVVDIFERFSETYPSVDLELNRYYVAIARVVDENVEALEDAISSAYEQGLPNFYIKTDTFNLCHMPVANLYEPQQDNKFDFQIVKNRLNAGYAQIEEVFRKINAEVINDLPHQQLFASATTYLNEVDKLECSGLILNLKKGYIQYKDNLPKDISPDNQIIKLLAILLSNKGEIVEYVMIGQTVKPGFYHEGLTNSSLGEPMRDIKKNLRKFLLSIGMTPNEFDLLISTEKNIGYRMNLSAPQ